MAIGAGRKKKKEPKVEPKEAKSMLNKALGMLDGGEVASVKLKLKMK